MFNKIMLADWLEQSQESSKPTPYNLDLNSKLKMCPRGSAHMASAVTFPARTVPTAPPGWETRGSTFSFEGIPGWRIICGAVHAQALYTRV